MLSSLLFSRYTSLLCSCFWLRYEGHLRSDSCMGKKNELSVLKTVSDTQKSAFHLDQTKASPTLSVSRDLALMKAWRFLMCSFKWPHLLQKRMRKKNELTLFLKDHDLAKQKQLGLDRTLYLVSKNNKFHKIIISWPSAFAQTHHACSYPVGLTRVSKTQRLEMSGFRWCR